MADNEMQLQDLPVEVGNAVPADEVETSTQVVYNHHVPGRPLETRQDRENRELAEREREDAVDPEVPLALEYSGIDVRHPRANLATRSNIVPAGPGSAGDEPVLEGIPGLPVGDQLDPARLGRGMQTVEQRQAAAE